MRQAHQAHVNHEITVAAPGLCCRGILRASGQLLDSAAAAYPEPRARGQDINPAGAERPKVDHSAWGLLM